jgi:hypothetical protein
MLVIKFFVRRLKSFPNLKLPSARIFIAAGIGYAAFWYFWLCSFMLPWDRFPEVSFILSELYFGYSYYLLFLSLYGPGLVFALIGVLAILQKKGWGLLLLFSHYAYSLWRIQSRNINIENIFTLDSLDYFFRFNSIFLFIVPFVVLHFGVLILLFWPRSLSR